MPGYSMKAWLWFIGFLVVLGLLQWLTPLGDLKEPPDDSDMRVQQIAPDDPNNGYQALMASLEKINLTDDDNDYLWKLFETDQYSGDATFLKPTFSWERVNRIVTNNQGFYKSFHHALTYSKLKMVFGEIPVTKIMMGFNLQYARFLLQQKGSNRDWSHWDELATMIEKMEGSSPGNIEVGLTFMIRTMLTRALYDAMWLSNFQNPQPALERIHRIKLNPSIVVGSLRYEYLNAANMIQEAWRDKVYYQYGTPLFWHFLQANKTQKLFLDATRLQMHLIDEGNYQNCIRHRPKMGVDNGFFSMVALMTRPNGIGNIIFSSGVLNLACPMIYMMNQFDKDSSLFKAWALLKQDQTQVRALPETLEIYKERGLTADDIRNVPWHPELKTLALPILVWDSQTKQHRPNVIRVSIEKPAA